MDRLGLVTEEKTAGKEGTTRYRRAERELKIL